MRHVPTGAVLAELPMYVSAVAADPSTQTVAFGSLEFGSNNSVRSCVKVWSFYAGVVDVDSSNENSATGSAKKKKRAKKKRRKQHSYSDRQQSHSRRGCR